MKPCVIENEKGYTPLLCFNIILYSQWKGKSLRWVILNIWLSAYLCVLLSKGENMKVKADKFENWINKQI